MTTFEQKSFQFQLGAIGSIATASETMYFVRFNSSLVRLGACFNSSCEVLFAFQFQLGAIGRIDLTRTQKAKCLFQFQLGAIGRYPADVGWIDVCCFNSSLVRLGGPGNYCAIAAYFVSIPAWCDWEYYLY